MHDVSGSSFNIWFQDVLKVRQRRVVRCEEGKNFARFVVMPTDFRSVNFLKSQRFFNEIVGVASSPKVRFELGGIVIGSMISLGSSQRFYILIKKKRLIAG